MSVVLIIVAAVVVYALAGIACVHVLLRARHPQAALGWVAAILMVPLFGTIAYFLFGINRVDSRAARLMGDSARKRFAVLQQAMSAHPSIPNEAHYFPSSETIVRAGEMKSGSLPRLGGNSVQPLFCGDEAYPAMLEAIQNACHEVFLCSYIFEGKEYGERFVDALIDAHKRGVFVRVLVDGVGTWLARSKPWKRLAKAGVPLASFLPPHTWPPHFSINLRNHRKILVCDGIGFTGGMNIADGHVMASKERKKVRDVHFRFQGPVVLELREAFLLDWRFVTGENLPDLPHHASVSGNMDARVVLDGLGSYNDPLNDLICGVISCAKEELIIFTPYFLPPRELASALASAVARGVDVQVVIPETLDHPYIAWAGERGLEQILEDGVRVFRQPGAFAHTKLLLVDDIYLCLGSVNLDPRSLSLNFELNVEVFSQELNTQMKEYCHTIIEQSAQVSLNELKQRNIFTKLRNAAVWIFSPYL